MVRIQEDLIVDVFGYFLQDKYKVNSLIEVFVVLGGKQLEPIIDEPVLKDVMIDLLGIPIGPYLLLLHLPLLPIFAHESRAIVQGKVEEWGVFLLEEGKLHFCLARGVKVCVDVKVINA